MKLLATLREWLEQTEEPYRDAMALATATRDGAPSVRMVSLRGIEETSIRFFTGLRSRKARELDDNPRAAALFFFRSLRRQIRLEGIVTALGEETCDDYFASRPIGHRHSWVQGERIASMTELAGDHPTARPAHWGGYRLRVEAGELWIGGDDRRHERIRFERGEVFRLAP
jgi:pyridoxamine 5'-phosphate oxidase